MFQLQSIENVILLQEAEISILPAVQLIVQPGGSCFLGANAEQKGCVRGQEVLPRKTALVDLQRWHSFHQIVNGFDLGQERFKLIQGKRTWPVAAGLVLSLIHI